MNPKAEKLLRLMLCPSAATGEVTAATQALRRMAAETKGDVIRGLIGEPGPKEEWRPPPDARINFGKYKGHMVSEVADDDPDYLYWFFKNVELRSPALARAVRYWVEETK